VGHQPSRAPGSALVAVSFRAPSSRLSWPVLAQSVVFLTAENIVVILCDARWLHTAWDIANLYLTSVGAGVLGPDAERIVGLSEETTCWVSGILRAEGAVRRHRRARGGAHLPQLQTAHDRAARDAPQGVAASDRVPEAETFAYGCEAYARILDLGAGPADRRALLHELSRGQLPAAERVDGDEYLDILREAVEARNGWRPHPCSLRARTTLTSDRRPTLPAGPTVSLCSSVVRVIAMARTATYDDRAISGGRRRRPSAAPACAGAGLAAAGSPRRAPGEPR
jgi:hypothetical protein